MCKRTIVTSCIKCLLIVIIGFAKNRLLMKLVPVKQVQGAYESTRKRGVYKEVHGILKKATDAIKQLAAGTSV